MQKESRQIKTHPQLLLDVITRQAGTISKAMLEGVMNSVDAKATRCDITLTNTSLVIDDDGNGFRSRDEIVQFFETFGTPHTEAEGKVYGTFRMGRGQIFAFGSNVWRTGDFRMAVDIKRRGFDYDLETLPRRSRLRLSSLLAGIPTRGRPPTGYCTPLAVRRNGYGQTCWRRLPRLQARASSLWRCLCRF